MHRGIVQISNGTMASTTKVPGPKGPRVEPQDEATRRIPGKFGELFENHETAELLGCPAPMPTVAHARVVNGRAGVTVYPKSFTKTTRLLEELVRDFAPGVALEVRVNSASVVGTGMASSTKTMEAGALAVCAVIGVTPNRGFYEWLAPRMAEIEPTDAVGVTDGHCVLWNFRTACRISPEYPVPAAGFVGAVPLGCQLLTDDVNRRRPTYIPAERQALERIRTDMERVLAHGLVETLAEYATISIEINSRYFRLPELKVLRTLKSAGLIHGYFGAHSGTCFGAICAPGRVDKVFAEFLTRLGPGYRVVAWAGGADPSLFDRGFRFDVVTQPGEIVL